MHREQPLASVASVFAGLAQVPDGLHHGWRGYSNQQGKQKGTAGEYGTHTLLMPLQCCHQPALGTANQRQQAHQASQWSAPRLRPSSLR